MSTVKTSSQQIADFSKIISLLYSNSDVKVLKIDNVTLKIGLFRNGEYIYYPFVKEEFEKRIHPDDLELYKKTFEEAICNEINLKLRLFNSDLKRYLSFNYFIKVTERGRDGTVLEYLVSCRNITNEEKEAEEKLEISNTLDLIVKTRKLYRWSFNIETGKSTAIDYNGTVSKYTRNSKQQLSQESGDKLQHFVKELSNGTKTEGTVDIEIVSDSFKKEYFNLTAGTYSINAKPAFIYGVWRNITEEYLKRQDQASDSFQVQVINKPQSLSGMDQVSLQRKANIAEQILTTSLPAMRAYSWHYDSREKTIVYYQNGYFERNLSDYNTPSSFLTLVHEDDRNELYKKIESVNVTKDNFSTFQFRSDIEKIGIYQWWESYTSFELRTDGDNEPYYIVCGITLNIDERKKNELEILRLNQRSELILNNSTSGLVYIDNNFVVKWSNIENIYGSIGGNKYSVGSICYKGFDNIAPCENCKYLEAITSGLPTKDTLTIDNRIYEITGIPVFDQGVHLGFVLKIDERTEYYKLIEDLNMAKARAEQSDKLKSAFLANMSHEIRTPLNAIVGFSDIVINTEDAEEKEEYGRIITNNCILLLRLIEDILDLSKIESGSFEFKEDFFDLNILFDEAFSTFEMLTDESVNLVCEKAEAYLMIYSDKNRFMQLLYNFLSNAVKYTNSGEIRFGYEIIESNIRMYVKDTGIGISEDNKKSVFQRFCKFDDFAQGTGLGLAICNALINSIAGADIGFNSKYEEGSYFWVSIPCKFRYCNDKIEVEKKKSIQNKGSKLNILVAEDIDSNFRLMQVLLKDHNLVRARNGFEAVCNCMESEFDIIFMDIKMPGMDGIEATRKIIGINKNIPIIAVTANAFDSDINNALNVGCTDFISKPLRKQQLYNVLNKYVFN